MRLLFIALINVVLLTGCVGGGVVKSYDKPDVPASEIATLFTPSPYPSVSAHTRYVDDRQVGNDFKGNPRVVKILPGIHKIVAVCYKGGINTFAYPSYKATFKKGHYYELRCKVVDEDYAEAYHIDVGNEAPSSLTNY